MSKSYVQLTPSVERRLSAWISLGEKRTPGAPREPRPTITVSRRFGCEAFPLCERLKNLLDERTGETWTIFDKALLERVSANEDLSLSLLQELGGPTRVIDTIGFLVPGYQPHSQLFQLIPKYVLRIAEAGNAIIVGRGGAIIAHELPNCYHFRLEGGFAFRAGSIARRLEVPLAEAQRIVRRGERTRERFIDECLHESVADPAWYDAVYNNARHDVEDIARSIAAYVLHSWASQARRVEHAAIA